MKLFIQIPKGIYENPAFTIVERHHGYCKVLDIITVFDKEYVLCHFNIPDEETALSRWLSPYYTHFTKYWRTIQKETIWYYTIDIDEWIKLKQTL